MSSELRYPIILVVLLAAEMLYFRLARRYSILDHPNNRSMHVRPVIRGGGIIFFIGVVLFFVMTEFRSLHTLTERTYSPTSWWLGSFPTYYFLLAVAMIAVVGFIDDVKSLSTSVRFAVQGISFVVLFQELNAWHHPVWWLVLVFIIMMGTINAYNFMDGINGITGGYSTVVLAALLYINVNVYPFTSTDFIVTMLIALCVFNYFNFRIRAVCFAGDVGSLTIGFIIIYLLLSLMIATGNYVWIGFLSVYAADSLLTILYRLFWLRENILTAHRLHFFQVMVSKTGISHLTMTAIYMFVQAVICVVIVGNAGGSGVFQLIEIVVIAVLLTATYIFGKRYFNSLVA